MTPPVEGAALRHGSDTLAVDLPLASRRLAHTDANRVRCGGLLEGAALRHGLHRAKNEQRTRHHDKKQQHRGTVAARAVRACGSAAAEVASLVAVPRAGSGHPPRAPVPPRRAAPAEERPRDEDGRGARAGVRRPPLRRTRGEGRTHLSLLASSVVRRLAREVRVVVVTATRRVVFVLCQLSTETFKKSGGEGLIFEIIPLLFNFCE